MNVGAEEAADECELDARVAFRRDREHVEIEREEHPQNCRRADARSSQGPPDGRAFGQDRECAQGRMRACATTFTTAIIRLRSLKLGRRTTPSAPETEVCGILARPTATLGTMTAILGLNAYHGDAAAALVVDGELVAAAEEERFNRVKHVRRLPGARRPWCLAEARHRPRRSSTTSPSPVTRARTSARSSSGRSGTARAPDTSRRDSRMRRRSATSRWPSRIRSTSSATTLARAGTQRRAPPGPRRERVLRLTVRRGGDPLRRRLRRLLLDDDRRRAAATRFQVLDRVLFPHSLGIFYAAFTQWFGFPEYGDEGKVMGLAPYGDPGPYLQGDARRRCRRTATCSR